MTRWFKDDDLIDYYEDEEISKVLSCYERLKKFFNEDNVLTKSEYKQKILGEDFV